MSSDEEEKPKPGYEALQKEQQKVKVTIKNNFDVVTRTLRDKKMLSKKDFEDVNDPLSLLPENTKVDIVFKALVSNIDETDENILKFIEILRKKTESKKTVERLEKAYEKQGGVIPTKCKPAPATQPTSGASVQGYYYHSKFFSF